MKILYGVVGEGMGHAIRSGVVIDHLLEEGHDVEIMASSRAADALGQRYDGVNRIHGFHIITEENRVRLGHTLFSNVLKGTAGLPRQIDAYFELTDEFEPEVVISDFESWTSIYGEAHRLPVFSVDNMQIIDRCELPSEIIEGQRANFEVARAFVRGKLPFSEYFLITTFFYPPIKRDRTALFPPILRPQILDAQSKAGDHLLVYQTAEGHDELADALASTGLECRIYGMRRDIKEEVVEGDLRYRPFSEQGFIEDLATAKGVVASSGFTLMGEAVYLRKPMLAVPLERQFEQTLNARYLEYEGYGMAADDVDTDTLQAFVNSIPRYEEALANYSQEGNTKILGALDELLDRAAADLIELFPGKGSIRQILNKFKDYS